MKQNIWKIVLVAVVIIIAGIIVVPKFIGQDNDGTDTGGQTKAASQAKIDAALKSGKPTLLLLRSSTWPACVTMGQLVEETKLQFDTKMNFIVVFVDKPEEELIGKDYNAEYVPTTVLFDKNGDKVESIVGAVDKDVLIQKLKDLID